MTLQAASLKPRRHFISASVVAVVNYAVTNLIWPTVAFTIFTPADRQSPEGIESRSFAVRRRFVISSGRDCLRRHPGSLTMVTVTDASIHVAKQMQGITVVERALLDATPEPFYGFDEESLTRVPAGCRELPVEHSLTTWKADDVDERPSWRRGVPIGGATTHSPLARRWLRRGGSEIS